MRIIDIFISAFSLWNLCDVANGGNADYGDYGAFAVSARKPPSSACPSSKWSSKYNTCCCHTDCCWDSCRTSWLPTNCWHGDADIYWRRGSKGGAWVAQLSKNLPTQPLEWCCYVLTTNPGLTPTVPPYPTGVDMAMWNELRCNELVGGIAKNKCPKRDVCIVVTVTASYFSKSAAEESSSYTEIQSSSEFQKAYNSLSVSTAVSGSYGAFSASVEVAYAEVSETASQYDQYKEIVSEQKTVYKEGFLQVWRQVETSVNIDGKTATVTKKEKAFDVSVKDGISYEDLKKYGKDYIAGRFRTNDGELSPDGQSLTARRGCGASTGGARKAYSIGNLSEECGSDVQIIKNLEECKSAALSLGFTITKTWDNGNYDQIPAGCSIRGEQGSGVLHFNTGKYNLACCQGRSDLRPICQTAA